jgi:flavin-dependent dehydrogenase
MKYCDVLVAGSGPAGAIAAYSLARMGHFVCLTDRDLHRMKPGEALPGAVRRLMHALQLDEVLRDIPHACIGGHLSAWETSRLHARDDLASPDGPGLRVDRACFDSELRRAAVRAGAQLIPEAVRQVARQESKWQVVLESGEQVSPQWLIDATGRCAFIARRLGARRRRNAKLLGLYATASSSPDFVLDRTLIEAVAEGWWYAGRLPSGEVLVGLHTTPEEAVRIKGSSLAWEHALKNTRHVSRYVRDLTVRMPVHVFDATDGRLDHFTGDGWIACGDAAVSCDPLSGQGLFSAIYTGMTAARVVETSLAGMQSVMGLYDSEVKRVYEIYQTRLRTMYQAVRHFPGSRFWAQQSRSCP